MNDTIFALATAPGQAAVAIVRLSGPGAGEALATMTGHKLPRPRMATVRRLADPVSRETLDQALVLWMPGPGSFTGEDVVELHLHGGRAVAAAVTEALGAMGLRPAGPGEFTRRAFEHGRLDLIEAEAIADLVDAESAAQRRQALAQLQGESSRTALGWRDTLVRALATLEATIDFPDEDLPETITDGLWATLLQLKDELAAASEDLRGERVRQGYRIALVGAPNAGKSSLLNRLVGREAAIVTAVPGTTRDIIEQPLELGGYRLLLADTAGLRQTSEQIEAEGVRRARLWAEGADLRLWVVDASTDHGAWREGLDVLRQGDILVLNKADQVAGADGAGAVDAADSLELEPIEASAITPTGVIELIAALERRVVRDLGGDPSPATRLRHRRLFAQAVGHLSRGLDSERLDPELMAEDVRLAARALEGLSGRVDAENVLEEIFASFCIGK